MIAKRIDPIRQDANDSLQAKCSFLNVLSDLVLRASTCQEILRPEGAATYQPRASPWEEEVKPTTSPVRATHHREQARSLLRAFRADRRVRLHSQGVALGWYVATPSGRKSEHPDCLDGFLLRLTCEQWVKENLRPELSLVENPLRRYPEGSQSRPVVSLRSPRLIAATPPGVVTC